MVKEKKRLAKKRTLNYRELRVARGQVGGGWVNEIGEGN